MIFNSLRCAAVCGALVCVAGLAGCASTDGAAAAQETADAGPVTSPGATLVVHGLGCPLCANNLDLELKSIEGVTGVEVDLGTGEVALAVAEGASVPRGVIRSTVVDAGFTLKSITAK